MRALTRVANADNEQLLLHMARGATGAALEKACAKFRALEADPCDEMAMSSASRSMSAVFMRTSQPLL